MSQIYGILGLEDTELAFVNTIGQRVVYEGIQEVLARHNEDLNAALSVFLDSTTEDFKFRYILPGGGYLQRRGGLAPSGSVKGAGQWDAALPLEDFGAAVGGQDVALAYMSLQDLNAHIDTVLMQDLNTVRFEVLRTLLDNVAYTFADPLPNIGNLSVVPLANGDSVLYPPFVGTEIETTENHYLESAYAAASITDTNNPYKTIVTELQEHFGFQQGGSNIITFINQAQVALTEALTEFEGLGDRFITPGPSEAQLTGLPANVPGRLIGRVSGSWVSEWRFVPANYMISIDLDAPKPLRQRVDKAYTGLPRGLTLVAESDPYPLHNAQYRHRFGLGVVNRLNGVVMELGVGGTYTIPTGYAHT